MAGEKYLENLRKYGPNARDRVTELERMAALANAREASSDPREMNMRAIAGNAVARKQNADLQQELEELGNQYKREARGVEAPEEGIIDRARNAIGLKKGGKVGSASKRADGIAKKGKTKGRMV
jgi:hypothetical protein